MKNIKKSPIVTRLILATIIFLVFPKILSAQTSYKLAQSPDVSIKVLGSSNIHDWVMTSTAMESQGEFTIDRGSLSAIHAFSFHLAFKSLKSEHTSMDNRTYKSVNAKKYPDISYKLTSAEITAGEKNQYLIKTKGDLTISGVTQPVSMDVTAIINGDNIVTCSGSKKIQLTDYGIKPPTFMLGAMKVYNDLTIQFNLVYKNSSTIAKAL